MPNHVEGYGVRRPGETYLPGSEFDPAEKFANAGDPEAAGKVEEAKQPAPEPFLDDAEGSEVVTDSGQSEVTDPEEVTDESQGITGDEKDVTPEEPLYGYEGSSEIKESEEPASGIKITGVE